MAVVHVFNLSSTTTRETLYQRFRQCGRVDDVELPPTALMNRRLGHATVRFRHRHHAQRAAFTMNGVNLDGNNLIVKMADDSSNRRARRSGDYERRFRRFRNDRDEDDDTDDSDDMDDTDGFGISGMNMRLHVSITFDGPQTLYNSGGRRTGGYEEYDDSYDDEDDEEYDLVRSYTRSGRRMYRRDRPRLVDRYGRRSRNSGFYPDPTYGKARRW